VLSASSNAAEVGVVGRHLDGGSWERWSLDDSARAECPLTDDYVDTFPMGVAVDFSSQDRIPLGIYSMFLSTLLGMGQSLSDWYFSLYSDQQINSKF